MAGPDLTRARRLVIKIGSALLLSPRSGGVRRAWLASLACDIANARARTRWIAGHLRTTGTLVVDDGAAALRRGMSLLPAGVVRVEGRFERGDAVLVQDAHGLVAYPAPEGRLIAGKRSGEIARILGYHGREEIIHRDDLALL